MPMDAVIAIHPSARWMPRLHGLEPRPRDLVPRPFNAEQWHLYDFAVHALGNNRGLTLGHVFSNAGEHIATVAQELLVRRRRDK